MRVLFSILLISIIVSCNSTESKKEASKKTDKVETKAEKKLPKLEPNRYNVAFLIMDGTYNTELTAPFDIFQHTIFREGIKAMNVFTAVLIIACPCAIALAAP